MTGFISSPCSTFGTFYGYNPLTFKLTGPVVYKENTFLLHLATLALPAIYESGYCLYLIPKDLYPEFDMDYI